MSATSPRRTSLRRESLTPRCRLLLLLATGPLLAAHAGAPPALLAAPSPSSGISATSAAPAQVLWRVRPDTGVREVLFVPAPLAAKVNWSDPAAADLSSLGLAAEQEQSLRGQLAEKAKSAPAPCRMWMDEEAIYPAPAGSLTLGQMVRQAGVAFVGKVTSLVPGLVVNGALPATLVTLQVEEVIQDPGKQLAGLASVSFRDYHGELTLGAVHLCATPNTGFPVPQVGQALLVGGFKDPTNAGNVALHFFAPVRGGQVEMKSRMLKSSTPVGLDSLRKELATLPAPAPSARPPILDGVPTLPPPTSGAPSGAATGNGR